MRSIYGVTAAAILSAAGFALPANAAPAALGVVMQQDSSGSLVTPAMSKKKMMMMKKKKMMKSKMM